MKAISLKSTTITISKARCNNCGWSGDTEALQYNNYSIYNNRYDVCPACLSDNTEVFTLKQLNNIQPVKEDN